jgi:hypothetical protein
MIADARVDLTRIPCPEALDQPGGTNRGGASFLAAPSPLGVDGRVDHGEGGHGADSV